MKKTTTYKDEGCNKPKLITKLFSVPPIFWLWLVLRIFPGIKWLDVTLSRIDNLTWLETGEAALGVVLIVIVIRRITAWWIGRFRHKRSREVRLPPGIIVASD